MALCKEFEDLSMPEKIEFIGKLAHASQSSTIFFIQASQLIREAESLGFFDGVKFNIDEQSTES